MAQRRGVVPVVFLALAVLACSGAQDGKSFDRGPGFVPPRPPAPLVRLARASAGACPGRCPTYSVEIDAEGDVAYAGVVNVKTIGPATGHIGPDALAQLHTLMGKARQAKFPTERCACGCVKDAAIVTLTTWIKNTPTTVTYEEGCERAPHAVRVLEEGVDDLVGVERWIGTIQQRRLCFEEERDCAGFGTPLPAVPDGGR